MILVLYPKPWELAVTVRRALSPPIDAAAVAALVDRMPDEPEAIEYQVLNELVPYAYDWEVYGVPWYFGTVQEALDKGRGDCEERAIVLASLFEAKGIPYRLRVSFDHIWVDYPQKQENPIEREAVAVLEHVDGRLELKAPEEFDFESFLRSHNDAHWAPMPTHRKVLLFVGWTLICLWSLVRRITSPTSLKRSMRIGFPSITLASERAVRQQQTLHPGNPKESAAD